MLSMATLSSAAAIVRERGPETMLGWADAPCARAADPTAVQDHDSSAPARPIIDGVVLSGGLFNQIWALQGLVMLAFNQNYSLVLPTFDSHLFASSMGERDTEASRPRRHAFDELFDADCFLAALRAHGVHVQHVPASVGALRALAKPPASKDLFSVRASINGRVISMELIPGISSHTRLPKGGFFFSVQASSQSKTNNWCEEFSEIASPHHPR